MPSRIPTLISQVRREIKVYKGLLTDKRTPRIAKWLLGAAIAYLASPIDLIPDFIPILGHLDDVIIVPLMIFLALKFIPKPLVEEYRVKETQNQGPQEA